MELQALKTFTNWDLLFNLNLQLVALPCIFKTRTNCRTSLKS